MLKMFKQRVHSEKATGKKVKKDMTKIESVLPYEKMYEDGICFLEEGKYSVSVEIADINYQLSSEENQINIFSRYCDFLNSLDQRTNVQLTLNKVKRHTDELKSIVLYPHKDDSFNHYRDEMNQIVSEKVEEFKNGYKKSIIFTFTQSHGSYEIAKKELHLLLDRFENYSQKIGSSIHCLTGEERNQLTAKIFNQTYQSSSMEDRTQLLPNSINFKKNKKWIELDEELGQVIYLEQYPSELSDQFLFDLLEIPRELLISFQIKPMEQSDAFDLVRTKLAFMEQQKVDEQKKALKNGYDFDMLPYELTYSLKEAESLLDDLQNKGQKLFSLTGLIYINAHEQRLLEEIKEEVFSVGRRYGFKFSILDYMQEISLQSALPFGNNLMPVDRTLSTASTAIFLPFTVSELIQENGKYYGVNAITKNIISIDRKQLKAPNGFVLGTPGSGKSFSVKREIVNVLLRDEKDEVIIIDPEREYTLIAENFKGEVIKISSDSKTHINPLDINEHYGDDVDPIVMKSEFLISLFDLIIGGTIGLTSTQKTLIDRVCRHLYEKFYQEGINRQPTLLDFYDLLKQQHEEEAKLLVMDLEIYIEGSLSVFSNETNVDINKRLVVYDIKDLGKQLKTMGMLIVLDQVWNRITENRSKGVRTWLYIDEMQLLFTNDYAANYFFELWSRARKWGAIPTGITQNVETLLLSDLARRMLSNSDFVMMLNQAKSDRTQLIRLFDISEEQEKFMINTNEGAGLLVYGDTTLPFYDKFPKHTHLYKMMSTKPGEDQEVNEG